jgi:hypothetical protein
MTVIALHTVTLLLVGIAVIVLGVTGIILGLRITRLERQLATVSTVAWVCAAGR